MLSPGNLLNLSNKRDVAGQQVCNLMLGVLSSGIQGAMRFVVWVAGAALPMPGLEELLDAQVFKEGALGLYFSP